MLVKIRRTNVVASVLKIYFAISVACLLASNDLLANESNQKNSNYSLTISGGISLGVYEAGVNWAIIELLRDEHFQSNMASYNLGAVTGASAGAINALISAIRFCEAHDTRTHLDVTNNSFYQIWDLQLVDLFPKKEAYNEISVGLSPDRDEALPDGLFTRSPFEKPLLTLKDKVETRSFHKDCDVDIAFIVSRTVPKLVSIGINPRAQNVPVQRYVIPLSISVQKESRTGRQRLVFQNNNNYAQAVESRTQYLLLPEEDGEIRFDLVMRAALASSAFPAAFGRVKLQYCEQNENETVTNDVPSGRCPKDHHLESGFFVDGGLFDNVPVGVAAKLARSSSKSTHDYSNFIYLDPGSTNDNLQTTYNFNSDLGSNNISAQLQLLTTTLTSLRKQQLSIDLQEHFSDESRNLLVTTRSKPIVGSFLAGFGAFIDRSFFQHDYAAGVFDGILNISQYLCTVRNDLPISTEVCVDGVYGAFDILLERLSGGPNPYTPSIEEQSCTKNSRPCAEHRLIYELINIFRKEALNSVPSQRYCSPNSSENQHRIIKGREQVLAVASVVCAHNDISFEKFIQTLNARRRSKIIFGGNRWRYDDTFEYIAANGDGRWIWGLAENALSRMYWIEAADNESKKKIFSGLWAMLPEIEPYNINNKPNVFQRTGQALVPDTVGIDSAQGGLFGGWEPVRIGFPSGDCIKVFSGNWKGICQRYSLSIGGEIHLRRIENELGYHNTTTAYAGIRYQRAGRYVFSSIGARYKWNRDVELDYFSTLDKQYEGPSHNSMEIYTGFFGDKVTLSIGFPEGADSLGDDSLTARIGLSGFDKFFRKP